MTITFTCSQCEKAFRVRDEAAGKRVKCKGCDTLLRVPVPVQTAPDDDFMGSLAEAIQLDDQTEKQELGAEPLPLRAKRRAGAEREERRKKSPKSGNLSTIAGGLGIIRVAFAIRIFLFLSAIIAGFLPGSAMQHLPVAMLRMFFAFQLFGGLVAGGLTLLGLSLSFAATPPKAQVRAFLVLAILAEFSGVCFSGLATVSGRQLQYGVQMIARLLGTLLSQVSLVFLLLYLKGLSKYIRYPAGSEEVDQLFVLVGAFIGLPLMLGALLVLPGLGMVVAMVGGIAQLGIALVILTKCWELLSSVKDVLGDRSTR